MTSDAPSMTTVITGLGIQVSLSCMLLSGGSGSQMRSSHQQDQHPLGTCEKCRILDSTPDLLD